MTVDEMRLDIARRSKKGISFILASVFVWIGILVVWLLPMQNILTQNLFTFFCTAPLMPLAFLFSKIIKAEFSVKDNPLNDLGLLFTLNQLIYILIAMWAYTAVSTKMVMILAMIFGGHLLPFSWLYQSKTYLVMSIIIPIIVLVIGYNLERQQIFIIPGIMILIEIIFVMCLAIENKRLEMQ